MALSILAGCETAPRKRPEPAQPRPKQPSRLDIEPIVPAPTPVPTPPPQGNAPPSPPVVPYTPPQGTFLKKELPKIGVILSGGGMKAFGHLGVLREFQRARIPIHTLTGLEWGAVMGGLYAVQGQVNDAEWKAFKLKESDLPATGGLLSARIKPQSIGELGGFLETAFGNAAIERCRVDFACPSYSNRTDKLTWHSRGGLREAIARCLPYPPLYADASGNLATPFSVEEAASWLRGRGANVIVLVNVLAGGEIFPAKLYNDHYVESLLWYEVRRELLRAKEPIVNWVINVDTTGHPIIDFGGRRAIMDAGAKAATPVVNKMASQYGF